MTTPVLVLLISVTALIGHLAYRAGQQAAAHRLARYLRHRAAQLETSNIFSREPAGMRYAADLIDPRTRRTW